VHQHRGEDKALDGEAGEHQQEYSWPADCASIVLDAWRRLRGILTHRFDLGPDRKAGEPDVDRQAQKEV
jgi:hypothetical protein